MKRSICIMFMTVCLLSWSLGGTAFAKSPEIRLKWAHIFPTDSDQHIRSEAIAKAVYEKSNGRIKFDIFPASQFPNMRKWLRSKRFNQVPQLTSGRSIRLKEPFLLSSYDV